MLKVYVPRETVNDESVIVRKILVESGQRVSANQPVLEVETSKTNIEIVSPNEGVVSLCVQPGDEIDIGALLFEVDLKESGCDKAFIAESMPLNVEPSQEQERVGSNVPNAKFSKAALRRMSELGLERSNFEDGQWVTAEDVEVAYSKLFGIKPGTNQTHKAQITPELSGEHASHGIFATVSYVTRTASKRKRVEIENLSLANKHGTTSTIGVEINLPGERVISPPFLFLETMSDLVVYEASRLLVKYPELNGFYIDSKSCAYYDTVNFGISFDSGGNLKVLAIENSNVLSLPMIQNRFEELLNLYESDRPIDSKLLSSSTVTLTDLSKTGATFMLPLINGRQSLILGLVRREPNTFQVFASFDHRLSDGRTVSMFLGELKERIVSYYRDEFGRPRLTCYACDKSMEEEISLGNRGFIKIATPDGRERLLCNVCFTGF